MKKIWLLLLLLAITAGCGAENVRSGVEAIGSYQDIPGVTEEERSAVEKLKTEKSSITIGHLLEMDAFLLPDGTYGGFTAEICGLFSELFELEFVQLPYSVWQQLRIDVDSGVVDFTGDITPVSGQGYLTTESIADRAQKIITLADREITVENDVNGLKLGFLENSVNLASIRRSYPDLSFEAVSVDYISSVENMLVSGEMDAFVTERNLDVILDGKDTLRSREFFPLAYTSVSLVTANAELAPVVSVINKYLESGGIELVNELFTKSELEYTKHTLLKSLTDEERAYLNDMTARGAGVRIAMENDNYPISFYNDTEDEFQGITVDILQEIGDLTGINFENVTTRDTTWGEILGLLNEDSVSLVSQLGRSNARKDGYIWSETPYSVNDYALISKADFQRVKSHQIPRLRVGVTEKSVYMDVYEEWFPNSDNLSLYPTQNDLLDALENGEIDLVMGAENILLTQVNYREKPNYIVNYRFDATIESLFGFNKNEKLLASIISKAQRQIDVESIESYWNSRVFDYSAKITEVRVVYLSVLAALMFLALVAMIFLFVTNRRLGKRLVEHSATLSTIYSSMPDTIFCKNTEGVYTSCNPSFEKQAGLPEAEIVGKTYSEVFGERVAQTAGQYAEIDKLVMSDCVQEVFEETVVYPDGTHRLLETLKAPMVLNGKVVGLMGIGRDITKRREVESRLERIINTAQIAFILTIDGIVVEANEYSRQHIGIQVGDDIRPFYSEPEQREAIIKAAEEQGTASNIVVKYNVASGESHRFLGSFTFVEYEQRSAYLVWALDIERDELKNDKLRGVRQSFQTVLDALPVPIRIVDLENSELVYVNDSLLELLEYASPDELYGLNIMEILPDVLRDGTAASNRVDLMLASQNPTSIDIEYRTKTGRIVEALVVTRQIDYQDRRSSIGIIKDLSAEKEQARMLQQVAEREKEANQSKSRFLANMSHEIRTPMNGVIGMTDLLMGEHLSGRQMQYVKDIKLSAESLLSIINDILDISKITEGKLQILTVDTDLSLMMKNTASMMCFSARSKGLMFIDDIQIRSPEYVRVDDVRLKQVIVNLLSNAIKFTKEGHVKLVVKIVDNEILFQVSDTGMGIRQEDIAIIFQAFEQTDRQKNRAIKGTGLGLSISRNLVELMGGRLWVESEYGAGSTFFVAIPYVPGDPSAVEETDMVFEYISAPSAQVLLVDDIQTNLTVGAGLLRQCRIAADVAVSGYEAIELVRAKEYDIVFMDHMMPDMDGIEATERIRALGGRYQEIPIIALTANAVSESRALLLSAGLNDFLSKPIDKAALMGILKKWLPASKLEAADRPTGEVPPSPYSDILEASARIEGLDIELALNRIGGLQDVLEVSLRQVVQSIGMRLQTMDAYLNAGDLRGFAVDAHGLKGALANIGAMGHSELAAGLEIAAKMDNLPQCQEKFAVFADAATHFAKELSTVFPQSEVSDKPRGDDTFLRIKTEEAIEFLNRFEAEGALKCLDELDKYTYGGECDKILSDAKDLARGFKYKKAVTRLADIPH